jgi:pimeloyl-ACP methyl ester carboxylesterase
MTRLADSGMLDLGDRQLEYRMIGPRPDAAPTIVMLHEGLGCVGLWGDFPDRLAAATGLGVFVYSRAGYGRSSPMTRPWAADYMHDEAKTVLPRALDAIGFQRGLLLGHSDGASIAAIYAGSNQDHRVLGLALIAPHFVVEDICIAAVDKMIAAYDGGDLRARLAKHHADADAMFRGWSGVWRSAAFRKWDISEELAYIRVPILIVQGEKDDNGTVRQVEIAQEECYCPVDVVLLPGVGHSPHREAADLTLKQVADFTARLLRGPAAAVSAA